MPISRCANRTIVLVVHGRRAPFYMGRGCYKKTMLQKSTTEMKSVSWMGVGQKVVCLRVDILAPVLPHGSSESRSKLASHRGADTQL